MPIIPERRRRRRQLKRPPTRPDVTPIQTGGRTTSAAGEIATTNDDVSRRAFLSVIVYTSRAVSAAVAGGRAEFRRLAEWARSSGWPVGPAAGRAGAGESVLSGDVDDRCKRLAAGSCVVDGRWPASSLVSDTVDCPPPTASSGCGSARHSLAQSSPPTFSRIFT